MFLSYSSVSKNESICGIAITSFTNAGNVNFSLNGTFYQNNSLVTLDDIGEGDDVLLCLTNLTACCRPPYTNGRNRSALGNWFFPNGTRVPSSDKQWDFHRTRGQMRVALHRRKDGEDGVYRCVVPDAMNVTQIIYIGVYSVSTGEGYSSTWTLLEVDWKVLSTERIRIREKEWKSVPL